MSIHLTVIVTTDQTSRINVAGALRLRAGRTSHKIVPRTQSFGVEKTVGHHLHCVIQVKLSGKQTKWIQGQGQGQGLPMLQPA